MAGPRNKSKAHSGLGQAAPKPSLQDPNAARQKLHASGPGDATATPLATNSSTSDEATFMPLETAPKKHRHCILDVTLTGQHETHCLHKLMNIPTSDGFTLSEEEVYHVESHWGHPSSAKLPEDFQAINNLCDSWEKSTHASRWLIFKFQSEDDLHQEMVACLYTIFCRPLMLQELPQDLTFTSADYTHSIVDLASIPSDVLLALNYVSPWQTNDNKQAHKRHD